MGRKGLRANEGVSVVCRLRLKKVEKEILQGMVESKRLAIGSGVTSIGAAVVALLRVAFNCLREHSKYYPSREPLSEEEALEAGLRIVRRNSRRKAKPRG